MAMCRIRVGGSAYALLNMRHLAAGFHLDIDSVIRWNDLALSQKVLRVQVRTYLMGEICGQAGLVEGWD